MKKRGLSIAKRIVASVLVIALLVINAWFLCCTPHDRVLDSVCSFYNEDKDSLDYVVMGASALQYDILPTEVYKNCGAIGADLCVIGAHSEIYISMLKEVLDNQKNAVIFVDLDGYIYNGNNTEFNATNYWIDTMRKNDNWKQTINELDYDNRLEHYVPFINYHKNVPKFFYYSSARWYQLFGKEPLDMRGATYLNWDRLEEEEMDRLVPYEGTKRERPIDKEVEERLYAFLDYCKDNDVKDVVFCDFPKAYCDKAKRHSIALQEQKSLYCAKIIKGYGYDVINFNNVDCGLVKEDFADSYHLKHSGGIKTSRYLADYISNKYEFSKKDQATIDAWDKSFEVVNQKYLDDQLEKEG